MRGAQQAGGEEQSCRSSWNMQWIFESGRFMNGTPALSGLTILSLCIRAVYIRGASSSKLRSRKGQADWPALFVPTYRNRWLLGSEIHHVNISSEANVVGQVPAVVIGIFVDDDVVAIPVPTVAESEIGGRNAPVPSVEPEAIGSAAAEVPSDATVRIRR